jgi:hypothetical protein
LSFHDVTSIWFPIRRCKLLSIEISKKDARSPNAVDENDKDRQPEPLARGDRGLVHPLRPLASSSVRGPRFKGDVEDDVVSSLVHSSMRQYAMISVRSEQGCERLVIEYPDEKSLRDLVAAPSILGLGYRSREEAQANIDGCIPAAALGGES